MRRIAAAVLTGMMLLTQPVASQAASSETYRQLNLFGDVFERIRADYVEEVKDSDLIEAAINGMLSSLDPHSSYLNAKNFKDMQVQTRGEFGGLGIEVTMENGVVKVISPIDDTPAQKAGVRAGDYITHLDGESIVGLTLSEAVERMRGAPGTDLKITIARPNADQPIDLVITRAIIKIRSVRYHTEKNAGYVRITSFNERTSSGLKKALREMKKELGDDMTGIILDLRNNPGGLLDQAVAVSDAFLDKGEIVSTRGRHAKDMQRYDAHEGDLADGLPLIVLINGGSASASEIVAGALQDHHRAVIVGTRSFGKGSVQTIIPLGSQGAMRLTTARYYTPSGRSIQAKGIEPDLEVAQAHVEKIKTRRPLRSEADLRGHLQNGDETPAKNKAKAKDKKAAPPKDKDKDSKKDNNGKKGKATAASQSSEDFQLTYALDLLRGLSLMENRAAR